MKQIEIVQGQLLWHDLSRNSTRNILRSLSLGDQKLHEKGY